MTERSVSGRPTTWGTWRLGSIAKPPWLEIMKGLEGVGRSLPEWPPSSDLETTVVGLD